ncbi:MAG: xanthine dehydrogenase family protein molybdopterin-binding subunit [Alphaproteobacteria bacterium]|nr:MAG: xanthine dehydrogenase family protein molybdopterin-binding subunit [Alphaproteobacteria bacterium]
MKFGISQAVRRKEDRRLLTGHGRFLEDEIARSGALRAVFVRAPVAHGRILGIDAEEALAMPGVKAVLTAADLERMGIRNAVPALTVKNRDGSPAANPPRPILAAERMRHVGEPVALVVAESLEAAREAAEAVLLDYEELEPHLELAPGGPEIHPEAPQNLAFDWADGDAAATEAAFARAARVVRLTVTQARVLPTSLETRGALGHWDGQRLHLAISGQGVWNAKRHIAECFGLDPEAVHVRIGDVGGGFGMKVFTYPEYLAVAAAARQLGRPVAWMAERGEAMVSDSAGRDLVQEAELALDEDLRFIGYRVRVRANLGAHNSMFAQNIQTNLAMRVLTGVYDIRAAAMEVQGIYTNTTPVDAYRGAGRPEAIYVLERLVDHAAHELGVDPVDLRRRNFIRPEQFPYTTVSGETIDVGDFGRVLDRALAEADVAGFPARRAASEARGRLRGLGIAYYIEAILGDPSESARVEFVTAADGRPAARLYVGTQSNGQGHETAYAQILADKSGIPFERIEVVQGDSDLIAQGGGTGGSRSVTTEGMAITVTAAAMVEALTPLAAELLEVPTQAVRFEDGAFRAEGANRFLGILDVAAAAREAGREDLLVHERRITLPGRSFPNGAHVCELEIDPETGRTEILRYTVADDFGVLINPMLAEGQVHGGVAQGIGQALMERAVFDDHGQPVTGSLMDYALPRAADVPPIAFHPEGVPSVHNPLGMKGCGEAGTVGALAAVVNAALDALRPLGVRSVDMPLTPARVWSAIRRARR